MDGFLGEIRLFSFSFTPKGWLACNGTLLPIAQNQALFSLLGVAYGGNGSTTFALPDLRGRAILGQSQGPGLSNYVMGQQTGVENVTLLVTQIPSHTHFLNASASNADVVSPAGAYPAVANKKPAGAGDPIERYADGSAINTAFAPSIANSGGSLPHPNLQPYLGMNYCICSQGIFPSRN